MDNNKEHYWIQRTNFKPNWIPNIKRSFNKKNTGPYRGPWATSGPKRSWSPHRTPYFNHRQLQRSNNKTSRVDLQSATDSTPRFITRTNVINSNNGFKQIRDIYKSKGLKQSNNVQKIVKNVNDDFIFKAETEYIPHCSKSCCATKVGILNKKIDKLRKLDVLGFINFEKLYKSFKDIDCETTHNHKLFSKNLGTINKKLDELEKSLIIYIKNNDTNVKQLKQNFKEYNDNINKNITKTKKLYNMALAQENNELSRVRVKEEPILVSRDMHKSDANYTKLKNNLQDSFYNSYLQNKLDSMDSKIQNLVDHNKIPGNIYSSKQNYVYKNDAQPLRSERTDKPIIDVPDFKKIYSRKYDTVNEDDDDKKAEIIKDLSKIQTNMYDISTKLTTFKNDIMNEINKRSDIKAKEPLLKSIKTDDVDNINRLKSGIRDDKLIFAINRLVDLLKDRKQVNESIDKGFQPKPAYIPKESNKRIQMYVNGPQDDDCCDNLTDTINDINALLLGMYLKLGQQKQQNNVYAGIGLGSPGPFIDNSTVNNSGILHPLVSGYLGKWGTASNVSPNISPVSGVASGSGGVSGPPAPRAGGSTWSSRAGGKHITFGSGRDDDDDPGGTTKPSVLRKSAAAADDDLDDILATTSADDLDERWKRLTSDDIAVKPTETSSTSAHPGAAVNRIDKGRLLEEAGLSAGGRPAPLSVVPTVSHGIGGVVTPPLTSFSSPLSTRGLTGSSQVPVVESLTPPSDQQVQEHVKIVNELREDSTEREGAIQEQKNPNDNTIDLNAHQATTSPGTVNFFTLQQKNHKEKRDFGKRRRKSTKKHTKVLKHKKRKRSTKKY